MSAINSKFNDLDNKNKKGVFTLRLGEKRKKNKDLIIPAMLQPSKYKLAAYFE